MRTLIKTVAVAAALALASPAGALAAGKVSTNVGGDITYDGDAGANVVKVTGTQTSPTAATLVFAETGITEGTDGANICTPSVDTVTCTFALTQRALFLNGAAGADELTLDGPARGTITGDAGEDKLTGGDGGDIIRAGADKDVVDGRGGGDTLDGEDGADVVRGGDGEDVSFVDDSDSDQIDLGAGSDWFFTNNLDGTGDALRGGPGSDTVAFATFGGAGDTPFTTVDLDRGALSHGAFGAYPAGTDSLESIENAGEFFGASGPDVLIGNSSSNVLAGGSGDDTIVGRGGTDTLLGDKGFGGADQLTTFGTGPDTIDAFDGFEDHVDCGAGTDSAKADQFDESQVSECETVDLRQADPFGIPPVQPQTPDPANGGGGVGGGPTGPQGDAPDVSAPKCTLSKLPAKKRAVFVRRGFALTLDCDEPARVEATAAVTSKARSSSLAPGDLVLGERTLDQGTGKRSIPFRVPRGLQRKLGRRFTVSLRVVVTDRAGNSATSFASFRVR
jgi:hypothetical protein